MLLGFVGKFLRRVADALEKDARMDILLGITARAASTMKWVTAIDPSAPRFLLSAQIFLELGDLRNAQKAILISAREYGEMAPFELLFCLGIVSSIFGDWDKAVSAFEQALSKKPHDENTECALKSAYICRRAGRMVAKAAQDTIATIEEKDVGGGEAQAAESRITVRCKLERAIVFGEPPEVPNGGWRAVYLVASDSKYFCRFAGALAKSIERNGGGNILLHLHIINPTCEALDLITVVSTRFANIRVSTEKIDLSQMTESQRKSYYSCARYLVLPTLLSDSRIPVIVTDMDQMLMSDPAPLLTLGFEKDVCLLRFEQQYHNLFSFLSATLLLLSPSPNAIDFSKELAGYIENAMMDNSRLVWHFDQAALAIIHLYKVGIKYGFIPISMVHLAEGEPLDNRASDVGIFWSITSSISSNLGKLETKSFTEFNTEP